MNAERLTTKSREVITAAVAIASQRGHATVEPWHLLLALLDTGGSTATALLRAVGANPADVRRAAARAVESLPSAPAVRASPSRACPASSSTPSARPSRSPARSATSTSPPSTCWPAWPGSAARSARRCKEAGATEESLVAAFPTVRGGDRRVTTADPEQTYQALEKYGVDLTARARDGKVDPVIGRDSEIRRVMQVLSRRTKNNPVLIGEPGVGKTAIVEGLAQRIVAGDVPESLRDKRLVSLDLGAMVAGAQYRGQFEERLKSVLEEIKNSATARSSPSSTSCTPSSAPARARARWTPATCSSRCWPAASCAWSARPRWTNTASTSRRTRRWSGGSSRWSSASRRVEDTIGILRGLKERYEVHHGVRITDAALVAAATLSDRYITDRFLPDKAIDLVDEAASRLRMEIDSRPVEVDEIERAVRRLEIEEMALAKEPDPASARAAGRLRARAGRPARAADRARPSGGAPEKEHIAKISTAKEQLERLRRRGRAGRARRASWSARPSCATAASRQLERQLATAEAELAALQADGAMLKEEVGADDIADGGRRPGPASRPAG